LPDVSRILSTSGAIEARDQVTSPEDLSLIASLRHGDEDAMMSLLQLYHSSMVRLALIHFADKAEAELVVKETWMAILQNPDQLQGSHSLKIEIHHLLINRIRLRQGSSGDHLPSTRLSEEGHIGDVEPQRFFSPGHPHAGNWAVPPHNWQVPLNPHLSRELLALIKQAIVRLPLDQREVITLRDIEGWSSSEVATLLGLSEHHLRGLLQRARAFIHQAIDDYF
jgi:RNA polymerase sigma-70 factor (ECF subfamily)